MTMPWYHSFKLVIVNVGKFITKCTIFEFILCMCSSMATWMMVWGIRNMTKSNVSLGLRPSGRQASPMLLVNHLDKKDLCHPLAPHCFDIVSLYTTTKYPIERMEPSLF
mgnify:CR=1 FL=1